MRRAARRWWWSPPAPSRSAATRSKLPKGALKLEDSQAAAAVGQIELAHAYEDAFRARSLVAAQVLLTLGDTEERRRYLNARNTMTTLLELGAVPVVNENDTVATSEIRYGDNDRLAARVASMMSADCLVLLSDIDGLYTAPPGSRADARRLDEVTEITPEIEAMAGDAGSELSKGGMVTKIEAAKIAVAGRHAHGDRERQGDASACRRSARRGACTWFDRPPGSGDGAQALDRRHAGAEGRVHRRCRGGPGARLGQEPAAGGRDASRGRASSAATPW